MSTYRLTGRLWRDGDTYRWTLQDSCNWPFAGTARVVDGPNGKEFALEGAPGPMPAHMSVFEEDHAA